MVEIDGMRLLYTGDYSRAADRHMSAADLPSPKPHIGVLRSFLYACQWKSRRGNTKFESQCPWFVKLRHVGDAPVKPPANDGAMLQLWWRPRMACPTTCPERAGSRGF